MNKLAQLLAAVAVVAVGCGGDDAAAEPAGDQQTVTSGQVPFDQAFIDAMVPHRREATEMAKAARARVLAQADLEKIANDIISSQQREIDQMLDWREQWFGSRKLGPVLPEVLGVPEREPGKEHGSADAVSGAVDVDAKFAEMMVAHHEGAIAMSEVANERGQHPEIEDLAEAIVVAQEREIRIMEKHAGEDHG